MKANAVVGFVNIAHDYDDDFYNSINFPGSFKFNQEESVVIGDGRDKIRSCRALLFNST